MVVRLQMLKRASCACVQHATSYFSPYTHHLANITPYPRSGSLLFAASLRLHYSCAWEITDIQGSGGCGERVARGCGGETGCFREPSRHLHTCLSTETLHRARTRLAHHDAASVTCFSVSYLPIKAALAWGLDIGLPGCHTMVFCRIGSWVFGSDC